MPHTQCNESSRSASESEKKFRVYEIRIEKVNTINDGRWRQLCLTIIRSELLGQVLAVPALLTPLPPPRLCGWQCRSSQRDGRDEGMDESMYVVRYTYPPTTAIIFPNDFFRVPSSALSFIRNFSEPNKSRHSLSARLIIAVRYFYVVNGDCSSDGIKRRQISSWSLPLVRSIICPTRQLNSESAFVSIILDLRVVSTSVPILLQYLFYSFFVIF